MTKRSCRSDSLFAGTAPSLIALAAMLLAVHLPATGDAGDLGPIADIGDRANDPKAETKAGQTIFEKEWSYRSPDMVKPDAEKFKQRLRGRNPIGVSGDGLGPMFNATSCEACHERGGGAGVKHNVTLLTLDPRSDFLEAKDADEKAVARDELLGLYPALLNRFGHLAMEVVVHEKSSRPFYDPIRSQIVEHVPVDAEKWFVSEQRTIEAIAEMPVLAGRVGKIDFYLSQRNSPALFGLNVIDHIDRSRLELMARNQNKRTDGKVTGRLGVGIFGWRGQTQSLEEFVRGACANEVGLNVRGARQPNDVADDTYFSHGLDLDEPQVQQLVRFVRSLPKPIEEVAATKEQAARVREGKALFGKIGCAICHVENVMPAKGVYSDFLLHDMGSLLQAPSPAPANKRMLTSMPRVVFPSFPSSETGMRMNFRNLHMMSPSSSSSGYFGFSSQGSPMPYQFKKPPQPTFPRGEIPRQILESKNPKQITWDALQREWRTPPLWGVADSAPYLHDGRAETLDAAIRWHGGEATDIAAGYRTLSKDDRKKIIAFLATLRAPSQAPRQVTKTVVEPPSAVITEEVEDPEALAEVLDVFSQ